MKSEPWRNVASTEIGYPMVIYWSEVAFLREELRGGVRGMGRVLKEIEGR